MRSLRPTTVAGALIVGGFCLSSAPAIAGDTADAGLIAKLACSDIADGAGANAIADVENKDGVWRAVSPARVAFFIETGVGKVNTPGAAFDDIQRLHASRYPADAGKVWDLVDGFRADLIAGAIDSLRAFRPGETEPIERKAGPDDSFWLFDPSVILRCKMPKKTPDAPAREGAPKVVLRGTTDALSATADDRLTAEAATIKFSRVRAYQDDGSRKQTDTYAVKAVLGLPLYSHAELAGLTAYGSYELKRDRASPPPSLTPPARQRDGDTNVFKLGLFGHDVLGLGTGNERFAASVDLALDGSYLFDFVKNSERARLRVTGGFYDRSSLGFCKIGDYLRFSGLNLRTRCDVAIEADINKLTRVGSTSLTGKESFAHVGGKASFAAYYGDKLDGPFVSAEWLYLRRVDGDTKLIPHINRHTFDLGYRWWKDTAFGVEVKAELIDGTNPDSLEDENSLSLAFGLIF